MATKTISLEIDAYERLKASKRPGESFSEVVRRAQFADPVPTGKDLLEWMRKGGSGVSNAYLDEVEEAEKNDQPPDDPWA
jgi:predicted CopG family antitoxin